MLDVGGCRSVGDGRLLGCHGKRAEGSGRRLEDAAGTLREARRGEMGATTFICPRSKGGSVWPPAPKI